MAFSTGVLAASLFFIVKGHRKEEPTGNNPRAREIDLTLGKAIIYKIPTLDEVSQLIQSNRLEQAQSVLCDHIWWELKEAWYINKKYDSSLDGELRPLLLSVYPRLKPKLDLGHFTHFPKPSLVEMTNFMQETDALLRSKR